MRASIVLISLIFCVCLPVVISHEGTRTKDLVIKLAEGIDPNHFAEKHNLVYMRNFSDYHIFQKPSPEDDYNYSQHEEVLFHAHQIARRRVKRSTVPWSAPTDPNYKSQWHLHYTTSVTDTNINVESVWQTGIYGDGVTVGIVDDGIDPNASDIQKQYSGALSYDYNFYDNDPTPYSWDVHGTEAATVASGSMNNNFCGVGVAPHSQSVGIRLLAQDVSDLQEAEALSHKNDAVFIYSNSWGPYDDGKRLEGPGPLARAAMERSILEGRNGKGSIYVWACGNGKPAGDTCNYDGYANSKFTIAVAAIRHDKKTTYYSEPCSSVLISSPSSDNSGYAISTGSTKNSCVSNFGGTSAACPMVAGAVALMLSANKDLTWRDVQAILIKTANNQTIYDLTSTDTEWTENTKSALRHNNKYGFGLIDTKYAVETALNWTPLNPFINVSTVIPSQAKSKTNNNISITITHDKPFIVEHVEVTLDISVAQRGTVGIAIKSPSGIWSTLQYQHSDTGPNIKDTVENTGWTYSSVKHWSEEASGEWILDFTFTAKSASPEFTLNGGLLNIWGHHE